MLPLAGATPASGPTSALQLALLLSLVTLAPAIILTCTSFARFLVVFSMLKNGLGTPGAPPNQVLVGLALFLTMFVMAPVGQTLYDGALQPYLRGALDEKAALAAATPPLRAFLLKRTRATDLGLFYEVSRQPRPRTTADVPLRIAIPAFVLSELRTGFEMGLVILLPFLVIDLVVAIILSALGMVMLPPSVIATPAKLLVFLAVDGWALVTRSLVEGAL